MLYLVVALFLAAIIVIIILVHSRAQSEMRLLNREILELRNEIKDEFRRFEDGMGKTSDTLADLRVSFAQLQQSVSDMRDLSQEVVKLQEILRPPKERGVLGEWLLENLLADILPESRYAMQYRFPDGSQVDAVIKLRDKLIPIDSKFPLDNFHKMRDCEDPKEKEKLKRAFLRDVRNRINEVSEKYVKPHENTLGFALLYIPAEGVYYEAFIRDSDAEELYRYALQKKVIPVSPNTFYAYLQLILSGLSGLDVEERAEAILRSLTALEIELRKLSDILRVLGSHLKNANDKFTEAKRQLENILDLLNSITAGKG